MRQNLEQQRAAGAMQAIEHYQQEIDRDWVEVQDQKIAPSSEYLSAIKALPAAVLQNGLGHTLASYQAASSKGPQKVFEHIQAWLCSDSGFTPFDADQPLLNQLFNNDQQHYLIAHQETLAYARWLKKLSIAQFPTSTPISEQAV